MKDQKGFTLLELMISITLLGLIIVIIASAMRLGYRSLNSGEKKSEEVERLITATHLMDAQIQSMMSSRSAEEGAEMKYPLSGGQESITFPSNYSLFNGQRGYVMVSYSVASEGKGQSLFAQENTIGIEEKRETKLMGPFDRIVFEYYLRDAGAEEGQWTGEWTDAGHLPERIRARLISGTSEMILLFPVRVGGPGEEKPVSNIPKEALGLK
ncbi:MAG: prepilin-type N-terminal cleavage/methylation domain-containing protein [Thermodesulfovibrionales bacterium]|jgi:general secretion pathway protein J